MSAETAQTGNGTNFTELLIETGLTLATLILMPALRQKGGASPLVSNALQLVMQQKTTQK
jgi:hypothetical protein